MNAQTILILVCAPMIQSLWTPEPEFTSVLNLISPNIESARCTSKCSQLTEESFNKCHEMCMSSEDLCRYSWLCGEECRQGCKETPQTNLHLLLSLQVGCELSWKIEKESNSPATFISMAEDKAGMWRLIGEGNSATMLRLTTAQTMVFSRVVVVAVSGTGVQDMRSVPVYPSVCQQPAQAASVLTIPAHYQLTKSLREDLTVVSGNVEIYQTLFFILALCCFVLSCTALLLYSLHSCSKPRENKVQTTKLSPIISEKNNPIYIIKPTLANDAEDIKDKMKASGQLASVY